MSLSITLYDENKILMACDSRTCVQDKDKFYALYDDTEKIRYIHDKLIFAGGIMEISNNILDLFEESENGSIEELQRIAIEVAGKAPQEAKESENAISVFAIAYFENGCPKIYSMREGNGFEINDTNSEPDGLYSFVYGIKSSEALDLLKEYCTSSLYNIANCWEADILEPEIDIIQKTYTSLAYECLGGNASFYLIDNQNNMYLLKKTKIKDTRRIKRAPKNKTKSRLTLHNIVSKKDKEQIEKLPKMPNTLYEKTLKPSVDLLKDSGKGLLTMLDRPRNAVSAGLKESELFYRPTNTKQLTPEEYDNLIIINGKVVGVKDKSKVKHEEKDLNTYLEKVKNIGKATLNGLDKNSNVPALEGFMRPPEIEELRQRAPGAALVGEIGASVASDPLTYLPGGLAGKGGTLLKTEKEMLKAADVGQKVLSKGKYILPEAKEIEKALETVEKAKLEEIKGNLNTQIKFSTERKPINIKPSKEPIPVTKVIKTPNGETINQVSLITPKGETIKASKQLGSAAVSVTKPMAGRTAKLEKDIAELAKDSDLWKDKQPLAFQRETWDRNIVDVAGAKKGEEIKKYIFEPIHMNEASRTRYLNQSRDIVKNMNLSKKESELVQLLGENKINAASIDPAIRPKIENAVKTFRGLYDRFLNDANEVLIRNGYEPVPKRADYFPHFEGKDPIMEALGIDVNMVDLPTDINGLTANFKPGKNWFGNFLKRTGDKTTYDAVEGFDRYVEGISRVIHHTDDIKKLRTFLETLRSKHSGTSKLSNMVADLEEYTNVLAGKKDLADRGAERLFGRQIYNITDAIRKRVGANMVAFNSGSWITNIIPVNTALATTRKDAVAQALIETMRNVVKNDGFINKSTFLTNRVGSDILSKSKLDKASGVLTAPFKWIDNFSSQVVTRSKYLEGIKKGLSESEALKKADDWAAKAIGDRSLGAQPTLFNQRGPITSWVTQFQLEVNNQLSNIFKDLPREYLKDGVKPEGVVRLTSAIGQLLIYDYLFNNLYEKYVGRRPAFDPIGIAFEAIDDFKNLPAGIAAGETIKNVSSQLPFTGAFVENGRLPIGAAKPNFTELAKTGAELAAGETKTGEGLKKIGSEFAKPAAYLLPPFGGGQIKKTAEAIKALSEGGEYSTNKEGEKSLKYPIGQNVENIIKGVIFGKSSLPEAKEYYDNYTKPLGVNQTEIFEQAVKDGLPVKPLYKQMLELRKYTKKIEEIGSIRTNKELSKAQQDKLIELLYKHKK